MDISIDSTLGKRKKRRKISEVASSFFTSMNAKSLDKTTNVSEISFIDIETASAKKKFVLFYLFLEQNFAKVIFNN